MDSPIPATLTEPNQGHRHGEDIEIEVTRDDIRPEDCPEDWSLVGYMCYRFFPTKMPWDSAKRVCRWYASKMLMTKDFESNDAVGRWAETKGFDEQYWIGMWLEDSGYQVWSDGKRGSIAQGWWANGQPAVVNSADQCASTQGTRHKKRWQLASCEEKRSFVCQRSIAPEGCFYCKNGRFVSQNHVCDKMDDCGDSSDEANCGDDSCIFIWENQTSGTFSSPRYPNDYPHKLHCSWLIEVPVGYNVRLEFTDFSTQVQQDEVSVEYCNEMECYPLKENRLSGDLDADSLNFTSPNNFLFVSFSSDGSISSKGFSANFIAVKAPVDEPYQYLTAEYTPQELISPNHRSSQDYTWIIVADNRHKTITLEIVDVDLKGEDRIVIRDGKSAHDTMLVELTASSPIPSYVLSTGWSLYITLQTRGVEIGRGFTFTYREGCHVTLTGDSGEIRSPDFDIAYINNLTCIYKVSVPGDHRVSLEFMSVKIHPPNRIKIYEDETLLHDIRNTNIPSSPIDIESGSFSVIFYAGTIRTDARFRLIYSIHCKDPGSHDNILMTPSISRFTPGTDVNVSCRHGYAFNSLQFLNLPDVQLSCQLGGKWNFQSLPECELKYCGHAPHVPNARIWNGTGVTYLGEVTYRCNIGFVMTGNDTIRCSADGWTSKPTCQSDSCLDFPDIDNGIKTPLGDGHGVTYSCSPGYQIVGVPTLFCPGDGSWSNQAVPRCEVLQCYVPHSHRHANLEKGGQMIDVGQTVMANCDPGYVIDSSGTDQQIVTCGADRTMLELDAVVCVYQNKCIADPSYCDHYCHDSEFENLTCSCRDGYTLDPDLKSCNDIDECQTDNGGCDICTNRDGGYECSCEDGYVLFTSEGVQGYELAPGEDGMRPGDIRRFNHTCLPVQCAYPQDIDHGVRMVNLTSYHYGDVVWYTCQLAFELRGVSLLTCNQSGLWDNKFPQCEPATCPSGVSSDPVPYGESIDLTCNVPGKPDKISRYCTYHEGQYQLVGAEYNCDLIDCGQPENVAGSSFTVPVNTKYGPQSNFEFTCQNLLRVEGSSRVWQNTTVRCTESGQWDFGSLRCAGMTCQDPGHPPDGQQVDVISYDLDALVHFACNKPGFQLSDPYPLKCQITSDGTGLEWNGTAPSCRDIELPSLTGCVDEVTVPRFSNANDVLRFPKATDNVGVKTWYVEDSAGTKLWPADFAISEDDHFTFIFIDFAANTNSCVTEVKVTDDIPPFIECPEPITEEFATGDDLLFDSKSYAVLSEYTVSPSEVQLIIQDPSAFLPFIVQEVNASVTDSSGRTTMCTFPLTFKAKDCSPFMLRKPVRGTKSCSPTGANGFQCTLSCDEGYVFDHDTSESSLVYSCSDGGSWDAPDTPVCIHIQQTFQFTYDKDRPGTCSEQYKYTINAAISAAAAEGEIQALCSVTDFSGFFNVSGVKEVQGTLKVYVNITFTYNMTSIVLLEFCKTYMDFYFGLGHILTYFKKEFHVTDCPSIEPSPNFEGVSQEVASGKLGICTNETKINWPGDSSGFYCVSCPEGTKKTASGCELCPTGTFNSVPESEDCEACPANTSTVKPGAVSAAECFEMCAAGLFSPTGLPPCEFCPRSTYWMNSTLCQECPGDSITRRKGATSESDCLPGCPVGTYNQIDGQGHRCELCPKNFYADERGTTRCKECPPNTYTLNEGSTSEDDCTDDPPLNEFDCQNGGQLDIVKHGEYCNCPDGYNGRYCELEVDPCSSNPCYFNGTCTGNGLEPICTCIAGTTGDRCERIIDSCAGSDYCQHGGACRNELSGKSCLCKSRSSGDRCEITTNICASDPCKNGGECESLENYRFYCHCSEGFEGPTCEKKIDFCAFEPCLNGGECINETDHFECSCLVGFSGKHCEFPLPQCPTADCGVGICVEDFDTQSHHCVCPEGYHSGTVYQYEALLGRELPKSTLFDVLFIKEANISDCMVQCEQQSCSAFLYEANENDCFIFDTDVQDLLQSGHGIFYERVGTKVEGTYWTPWYSSSNPNNAAGDDERRSTLDDTYGLNICRGNTVLKAECRVVGSHTSPTEVLSINCTPSGGLLCNNNEQTDDGQCEDYEIRFLCLSAGLFQSKCEKRTYCNGFCENSGICSEEQTGGKCTCFPGYTGSRCQHLVDHCSSSPCPIGATCQSNFIGYTCDCPPGYTGDDCDEYVDYCVSNPCNHAGSCMKRLNGYECHCEAGFTGRHCEEEVDECQSNPCLHDGVCTDEVNGFTCDCKPGWTGSECEDMVKLCEADTCHEGATCVNLFNDFYCNCPPKTVGKTCSSVSSICNITKPCLHGSPCYEDNSAATCECSEELVGEGCHIWRDVCNETHPLCQNGATCRVSQGNFSCECPPGYKGRLCEENVNDCEENNCPAGWTCTDMVNKYCCRCPVGEACEKDIDRDFDLYFSHKSTMAALPCPVHLEGRGFTITMWIQYSKKQDNGTFFTMYKVNDPNSLSGKEELIRLDHDGVTVSLNNQTIEIQTHENVGYSMDLQWHFIAVTWRATGVLTFFVDTVRIEHKDPNLAMLLDMSVWIVLGGRYDPDTDMVLKDQGFHGTISHVTLYNRELEFDNELTVTGNVWPGHIFPDAVMAWGEFLLYPGVTRVYPSGADKHCPPGLTEYPTCITPAPGKTMVNVVPGTCPQDIIMYSPNRVTQIPWYEVKFTGGANKIKSSLPSGMLVLWGKYEVVVVATNEQGNKALCTFDIYIQYSQCESPSIPVNAEDVSCSNFTDDEKRVYKQCSANCQEDYLPVIPFPKISTCGPIGSWDPPNLYLPYKFPPCGESSIPRQRLLVKIVYRVPSHECEALEGYLATEIRLHLWEEVGLWNIIGLCYETGCSDIQVDANCTLLQETEPGSEIKSKIEIKIMADYFLNTVTINNEQLTIGELFQLWIFNDSAVFHHDNEIARADPDHDESTVEYELLCQAPLTLMGDLCVECASGSYYDINEATCVLCPIGQYQPEKNQSECMPCGPNTTTETEGSYDSDDCKQICPPGQYFDMDKDNCTLCHQGFYQNVSGLFYCLPCPADKTTRVEGADSSSLCFNDCPTGQELTVNGSCAACAIGFYKPSGPTLCLQCPQELVTNYTGADSEDDCSVANNPAGFYRSPTNETEMLPCPVGTYQPEKWQYDCISCGGERYRTDSVASISKDQCKFFCPPGEQQVGNKEECMPCPIGFFRTGINPYSFCEPCPNKTRTPTNGSISADDCTIKFCPAGSRINGSVCEDCPQGTYQDQPYQTECLSCPEGNSTRQMATTSANECETFCEAGSEKNAQNGQCDVCPIGYYKNNDDDDFMNCTSCRQGYITPTVGSTHNSSCNIRNCTAGYFILLENCQPCDYGQYQNLPYQTFCHSCEGAKNTTRMAAVSASECLLSCPAGEENPPGSDNCEACPQGFYKDHEGFENCTQCPPINTTRSTGSTNASDCELRACEPGSYADSSRGGECRLCGLGEYQPDKWQEECLPCDSGLTTYQYGADRADLCFDICGSGTVFSNTSKSCMPCPIGYYNNDSRAFTCTLCPVENITISTGAASASDCTVRNCTKPGQYRDTEDGSCKDCPIGEWQNQKWKTNCIQCKTGFTTRYTGSSDESDCKRDCDSGSYLKSGICVKCEKGYYRNKSESWFCEKCPKDLTTLGEGANAEHKCSEPTCASGKYFHSQTRSCVPCEEGHYQDEPGKFRCKPCPIGYESPEKGASSVSQCIDKCDIHKAFCDWNARCMRTGDTVTCQCNRGYIGTGYNCTHVCAVKDYCTNNTIRCDLNNLCVCKQNYEGERCENRKDSSKLTDKNIIVIVVVIVVILILIIIAIIVLCARVKLKRRKNSRQAHDTMNGSHVSTHSTLPQKSFRGNPTYFNARDQF